jgi:hypothetical protein
MIIQWWLLVLAAATFLKNEPAMNDYKGCAMNDYTMVVVIFSAMFLKNEPLGITMNDYSQAVL